MSATRNEIGRFEDDGVAIGERRRDLPSRDCEREVPRCDDADDPKRLAHHLDVDVRPHAGEFLAGNPQRFTREEVEDLPGPGRLADAFREGLALFARQQAPELLAAGKNFGRGAQQNVVPLLRRRSRPGRERGMRGFNRGVGLSDVGLRIFADKVVCIRRIDVASDTGAVDPFSGDKVLVRAHC